MRRWLMAGVLLWAQACAYERAQDWSAFDGAVQDTDAGALISVGALAFGLDRDEALRLVPSSEDSGPEAREALSAPRAPVLFRELPSEVEKLAGTWYAERNTARFGAEAIRVPIRDRGRPTVEDLGPGDTLLLDMASGGCFYFFEHDMVVTGGRRLRAEVTGSYGNERFTAFTLTEDDVEDMDDAFENYRSRPGGGCTSYELIHAVWRIHGQLPIVEYLYDGSCSSWDGATTLVPLMQERLDRVPRGTLRPRRGWLSAVTDLFR